MNDKLTGIVLTAIVAIMIGGAAGYTISNRQAEEQITKIQAQSAGALESLKNQQIADDSSFVRKYTLNNEQVYIIATRVSPLTDDVVFSNGTRLMNNGDLIKKDGSQSQLLEGKTINSQGVIENE